MSDFAERRYAEGQALVADFNSKNKRYTANCELFDHGNQLGIAVIDNETGTAHACRAKVENEMVSPADLLEAVIDWFEFGPPRNFAGIKPENKQEQ